MADVCASNWTLLWIRPSMAEPTKGLLDTSVLIDHDVVDPATLPDESAIAAVTLAELAAGPHATGDDGERARRQDRLQWASSMWGAPPVRCGGGTRLRSYLRGHAGGGAH